MQGEKDKHFKIIFFGANLSLLTDQNEIYWLKYILIYGVD
jgi:hypothetical protein